MQSNCYMERVDNIRLIDFIDFMYDSTSKLLEFKHKIDCEILADSVLKDAKRKLSSTDYNWLVDRNDELKRVSNYIKSIKESEDEEDRLRRAAWNNRTDDLPF